MRRGLGAGAPADGSRQSTIGPPGSIVSYLTVNKPEGGSPESQSEVLGNLRRIAAQEISAAGEWLPVQRPRGPTRTVATSTIACRSGQGRRMIYLHKDRHYQPDQWYRRFEFLMRQRRLAYRKVDLLRRDYHCLKVSESDALIGRFGHAPHDLARMKPIYPALAAYFEHRIFPNRKTYEIYDDKKREMMLLQRCGYPTPSTAYVSKRSDIDCFLAKEGLRFPLVTKRSSGAGSAHVRLANCHADVFLPGIVQEFCAGNDRDLRLIVIGDRVMGFERLNRPDDFRASGSGQLLYRNHFDPDCIELVYRISHDHQFDSMSYDLVKDSSGQWVVLEMSYTYVDTAVRDCPFYYDMRTGGKVDKPGDYPQDFILEDFLAKYPTVELLSRQAYETGNFLRRWSSRLRQPRSSDNEQISHQSSQRRNRRHGRRSHRGMAERRARYSPGQSWHLKQALYR